MTNEKPYQVDVSRSTFYHREAVAITFRGDILLYDVGDFSNAIKLAGLLNGAYMMGQLSVELDQKDDYVPI